MLRWAVLAFECPRARPSLYAYDRLPAPRARSTAAYPANLPAPLAHQQSQPTRVLPYPHRPLALRWHGSFRTRPRCASPRQLGLPFLHTVPTPSHPLPQPLKALVCHLCLLCRCAHSIASRRVRSFERAVPWNEVVTDRPWTVSGQGARSHSALDTNAVPRFAIANSLPQAHDECYRKSAMPIAVSTLATHAPEE